MRRVESVGEVLAEHVSFEGKVVVDVGCGPGDLVRWMVGRGATAVGVDTPAMLEKALAGPLAGGERYLPGGGEALPLADRSADVVVWVASLHHVPAERMRDAVCETARVLRPGGEAVFVEPVAEPGSYYEITRLVEEETEARRLAQEAIRAAPSAGFEAVHEGFFYFERSLADYEHLLDVFVDCAEERVRCLAEALRIAERLAAAGGVDLTELRLRSICRLSLLRRRTGPAAHEP